MKGLLVLDLLIPHRAWKVVFEPRVLRLDLTDSPVPYRLLYDLGERWPYEEWRN